MANITVPIQDKFTCDWIEQIVNRLRNDPEFEWAEVIRCKDCKHYKDGFCYNPNTYDDGLTFGNTTEEWFCADGKRRDENDITIS